MKARIVLAFLIISLAACAPAAIPVSPTNTSMPTSTSTLVPPTLTLELTPALATPLPTNPMIPIMTPDAPQVARWKEYQAELAKVLLSGYSSALYRYALCEWDILGRSDQIVYVWALCAAAEGENAGLPAVIHLNADGSVQDVKVPEINNATWDSQIREMFPADVREKIGLYTSLSPSFSFSVRAQEMESHLEYRQTHSNEPPLIILSATPVQ